MQCGMMRKGALGPEHGKVRGRLLVICIDCSVTLEVFSLPPSAGRLGNYHKWELTGIG